MPRMLPVFTLSSMTAEEHNAMAREINTRTFVEEFGRPPKSDREYYGWLKWWPPNWEEKQMNELIKISYDSDSPTVSGRDLHESLKVDTEYRHWFPRMCEYGFVEGVDLNPVIFDRVQIEGDREVSRSIADHRLSIPMAKEIAMLQRTEQGKQIRQYLIRLEDAWNTPEMVMSRALKMAEKKIKTLTLVNSRLTVDNQIMRPKSDYFDELVDRNLLTSFRETAKELEIKEKDFIAFLLDKKFIYRDKKGKLMPYADKNNGLFEIKECFNEKTQWSGTQTLVTPKGRETFRLLYMRIA